MPEFTDMTDVGSSPAFVVQQEYKKTVIHVSPERHFRGTKWRAAERSEVVFGRGVWRYFPGNFQKPVLQMVHSEVFRSYICEYN